MKKDSGKIKETCLAYNKAQAAKAVEAFEQGETAEYFRENAGYVTGLVVMRLKAIEQGKQPYPLRPYDAETLARLMTAQTDADYECRDLVGGEVREGATTADTPTARKQAKLRAALVAYARAAAAYAKSIGSASLLSWAEIIDILENRHSSVFFPSVENEAALRLIELEKAAADRLRLDKIAAELPAFHGPHFMKCGQTGKPLHKPARKAKR